MLHQVLADAGAVGDDADAERCSSFAGPMPLRIRNAGDCSAPIDTMVSRAEMSIVSPRRRTRTPVTRVPSNSSRSARVPREDRQVGALRAPRASDRPWRVETR